MPPATFIYYRIGWQFALFTRFLDLDRLPAEPSRRERSYHHSKTLHDAAARDNRVLAAWSTEKDRFKLPIGNLPLREIPDSPESPGCYSIPVMIFNKV
jgi:hypothetical protein